MKFRYIFYVLLFSLLFVFSLSNSFALTLSDFENMTTQAIEKYAEDNHVEIGNHVGNIASISNLLNSNFWYGYRENIDFESYNNFLVRWNNNSSDRTVNLFLWNDSTTNWQLVFYNHSPIIQPTGDNIPITNYRFKTADYNDLTNWSILDEDQSTTTGTSLTSCQTYRTIFFYQGTILNQNNYMYYGYNIFNFINAHNIIYDGNTYTADVKVGSFYNINDITYKVYSIINNSKVYLTLSTQLTYTQGTQGQVGFLNIRNYSGNSQQNCYIEMVYNDSSVVCTSNDFDITVSSGSGGGSGGGSTSGDSSTNIDLTVTNNKIDNVANKVEENTQQLVAMESGEKERFDFWKDNLFKVSSGDLQEIYQLVESYFPSGDSGDNLITIYDTIFGSLNNSPGDFIIHWENHPLNFTSNGQPLYSGDFITAGYINISQVVNDNDVLRLIKFWVNTFVVIGFLLTYYHTLYNSWLHILGVVSEDADQLFQNNDNYKRNNIGFKM